jgi:hypothetical protein
MEALKKQRQKVTSGQGKNADELREHDIPISGAGSMADVDLVGSCRS